MGRNLMPLLTCVSLPYLIMPFALNQWTARNVLHRDLQPGRRDQPQNQTGETSHRCVIMGCCPFYVAHQRLFLLRQQLERFIEWRQESCRTKADWTDGADKTMASDYLLSSCRAHSLTQNIFLIPCSTQIFHSCSQCWPALNCCEAHSFPFVFYVKDMESFWIFLTYTVCTDILYNDMAVHIAPIYLAVYFYIEEFQ